MTERPSSTEHNPPRVALVLNKASRELPIMEKIRDWLTMVDPGCQVMIIDFHQTQFHADIMLFAPDIILTFPFTAVPLSWPFLLIKLLTGCSVVCLRTEGAINFNSPQQVKWLAGMDRYGPEFVDFELFWGHATAQAVGEMLLAQGRLSSLSRVRYFGYPNLEPYFDGNITPAPLPEDLARQVDNYDRSQVFFFITGFHLSDYTDHDLIAAGDILRPDDPNFDAEFAEARQGVLNARRFREQWITNLLTAARKHPDALFLIKCHPIEAEIHFSQNYPNPYLVFYDQPNIVYITDNIPISTILPYCGLFFHYGSTCVAESYLLKVPSAFVTSAEVYGADFLPSVYNYSNMGWPSTLTIDVTEIPALVDRHLAEPVLFNINNVAMEEVLSSVFNITRAHLAGTEEYAPSRDIAHFLVEQSRLSAQKLPEGDTFLEQAVRQLGEQTYQTISARVQEALSSSRLLAALGGLNCLELLGRAMNRDTTDAGRIKGQILAKFGLVSAEVDETFRILQNNGSHKSMLELHEHPQPLPPGSDAIANYSGNIGELCTTIAALVSHALVPAKKLCIQLLSEAADQARPLAKQLFLNLHDDDEFLTALVQAGPEYATLPAIFKEFNSYQPRLFMIETTLACDLQCPECAMGAKLIGRKGKLMSFNQFKVLADKIRPYADYLYLHIWGEPMLNPDIIPMIRYAASFTKTNISTNGMSLTNELAEELILSGVSDIIVSIDGFSQEVYQQYRVGGHVDKALQALDTLQQVNSAHGNRVNILPQFIVFKHNQHEMPQFTEFCHSLGLQPAFKAPYLRAGSQFELSDHREYIRAFYDNKYEQQLAMQNCPDPRLVMTVLVDGSVVVCCYDHNGVTCMGNLFDQDVTEIWHGKRSRALRWMIVTGNAPESCTGNCLTYCRVESSISPKTSDVEIMTTNGTQPLPFLQEQPTAQSKGTAPIKRFEVARGKHRISCSSLKHAIDGARICYYSGRHAEAFDLYEQITLEFPEAAVAVLTEVFDRFEGLPDKESRYHLYQSRYFDFGIEPRDRVLDIGSGHLPFPFATHLADLSLEDGKVGRAGTPFKQVDGKPVYQCSVEELPFGDKEFDFIYCSHVLEHVSSPENACKELMRVGKRGYIETPTRGKDLWLNTAMISNHRWAVELLNNTLIFTEYSPEDIEGLSCSILLDMHCNPQTDRERALSALVNLKADKLNTMLYWEESINFEVRRLRHMPEIVPPPLNPPAELLPAAKMSAKQQKHSCVFLNTYYEGFIKTLYQRQPHLVQTSYATQHQTLQQALFGDSNFYSQSLMAAGWISDDLIVNIEPLQRAWGEENGCCDSGLAIALAQLHTMLPDVLYIQDMHLISAEFLTAVRPLVKLIVGQIASPFGSHIPIPLYDIVITSFPHYVERIRRLGITVYYQPLAFEPRVLNAIRSLPFSARPIGCSFVGGISGLHTAGTELLKVLVDTTPLCIWGYGAESLPEGSALRQRHHGEVWGSEMFTVLASSKITVNRHVDVAENYANNMRLFEATGCGALLITDYKDNLHELFEIGVEVVAYRSSEECAELINYYLAHPDEAEAIARAGQERTLREHTYARRMEKTAELLERHLRYRAKEGILRLPDRISDGHQPINSSEITSEMTSAWQSPHIPARQRALVQHELTEMYKGRNITPFSVLAEILRPTAYNTMTILEIGCASGYYYEALEYLLSKQINYTGVDYSQPMIDMAQQYYPKATFFCSDGAGLPFADRQFETVISSCVLLHVPNYRQHIFETARVSERYVVISRTPICKRQATLFLKKFAYGIETVELIFNEQELLEEFELNGFRLLKTIEYQADSLNDRFETTYLLERVSTRSGLQHGGNGTLPLVKILRRLLREDTSLLEVGCLRSCTSELITDVLSKRLKYRGIDEEPVKIDLAKATNPKPVFEVMSAENLISIDNRFDIVIHSSELMRTANYRYALRESRRVANRFVVFHNIDIADTSDNVNYKINDHGDEITQVCFSTGILNNILAENRLSPVILTENMVTNLKQVTSAPIRTISLACYCLDDPRQKAGIPENYNFYCTYFDVNYLARGALMMRSLMRHDPMAFVFVLCLDDLAKEGVELLGPNIMAISVDELMAADPEFASCRNNRSQIEWYFTATSVLVNHLLNKYGRLRCLTYLDADLYFYSSPEFLHYESENTSVQIIEHRFGKGLEELVKYGRFNVGWITFTSSLEGRAVVADYRANCIEWCYDRLEGDRFGDQKYLDRWPAHYPNCCISQIKGANVAYWNLSQWKLRSFGQDLFIDEDRLVFYHFQAIKRQESGEYAICHDKAILGVYYNLLYVPYFMELSEMDQYLASVIGKQPLKDIRNIVW